MCKGIDAGVLLYPLQQRLGILKGCDSSSTELFYSLRCIQLLQIARLRASCMVYDFH